MSAKIKQNISTRWRSLSLHIERTRSHTGSSSSDHPDESLTTLLIPARRQPEKSNTNGRLDWQLGINFNQWLAVYSIMLWLYDKRVNKNESFYKVPCKKFSNNCLLTWSSKLLMLKVSSTLLMLNLSWVQLILTSSSVMLVRYCTISTGRPWSYLYNVSGRCAVISNNRPSCTYFENSAAGRYAAISNNMLCTYFE